MDSKNNEISSWVDQHADYLFQFAITRVPDENQAKEVIQDTFLAAVQAYDKFEGKSTVRTWLTAILKRKIFDYYKQSKRQFNSNPSFFDDRNRWLEQMQPKAVNFADKSIEQSELKHTLDQCISDLPAKNASAFVLKNIHNYETEQICKELKITKSNYWVLVHRARLQLRQCLEKKWFNH